MEFKKFIIIGTNEKRFDLHEPITINKDDKFISIKYKLVAYKHIGPYEANINCDWIVYGE